MGKKLSSKFYGVGKFTQNYRLKTAQILPSSRGHTGTWWHICHKRRISYPVKATGTEYCTIVSMEEWVVRGGGVH